MKRVVIGMQVFDAGKRAYDLHIHTSREFVFWLFLGGTTGRSLSSTPFPTTLQAKILSAVLRAPNRLKNALPTYVQTNVRVGTEAPNHASFRADAARHSQPTQRSSCIALDALTKFQPDSSTVSEV